MTSSPPETTTSEAFAAMFDESVMRDRLMRGMSESLIEKGFDRTVVADIVKRARVSRRTFYEEFSDRSECFLELCDRSTDVARSVIAEAADPSLPWHEQARRAADAYFDFMTIEPQLTRAMLFEIYALGDRGRVAHQKTHHAFTEQLLALIARARTSDDTVRDISYVGAAAVIGAIYQLIQMANDDSPRVTIDQAREVALEVVLAMTSQRS